ncbi:Acetyl-coenzyme A carboxyl transferase alpha chain [Caloramator australicus RC3]|uniref:Acetyl-coenzyme A carboxylase carboxyl transferase subunit alpha n=1 Tax=Caloramator australicus RC3 TaxID=857293 RepID=I7LGX8_9CLOT|nr:acetyl-CoA carboxylase carboxyltransferase subunit alpha [Caloramator australicus]CCJ33625.1 Acetyl-coenzyme A carboxyl transferase alpha chain [Caloramator australicus RC3]
MNIFEIEKASEELKKKIKELKEFSKLQNIDLSSEIEILENKLKELQRDSFKNITPWDKVLLARKIERPTSLDLIKRIFDNFIELHGDRLYKDDAAILGGIALLEGKPVTVIGQQKGKNTEENIKRNFGMPHPEGYRKALRLMKQAEKFKRPVICFIDTPGAFCGIGSEERGQGEAIARNLFEMSNLKTPIISIVIGEGGSGGALALAVGDRVWMLEHAIYSILSPEGFASILWKDASKAKEAASLMKLTAQDLLDFGIIDRIIKEPIGGAHRDVDETAKSIKQSLVDELELLRNLDIETLLNSRYEKFRRMGKFLE